MKFIILITTLFIFLSTFLLPLNVSAQDSYGEYFSDTKKNALGITPAINEVILEEGKVITKEITVNNLTNFALPLKLSVESLTPKNLNSIPKNLLQRYDSTSWFDLSKNDKDFILQPKESKKIKVNIKQPVDAKPGGYYASIIFQPLIPEQFYSRDSVYIFSRVASVFLLQVKGDIQENISLEKLSLPLITDLNNIDYSIVVKNNGNTHTRPLIKLSYRELLRNRSYGDENILPEIVLPELTEEFRGSYTNLPTFGIMEVKTYITYGPSNILVDAPTNYIVIFPYKQTALFFIVASILILSLTRYRFRIVKAFRILIRKD